MLSVKTIVELDVEVPERGGDREPRSEDLREPCRPHSHPATLGEDSCDGSHPVDILIPEDPRRAGCLSLWLMGVMVANGCGFILMLYEGRLDPVACGLCLANVTFAAALWHLRKWGAYGLAASFGLFFVLGMVVQDLFTIVSSIVPMVLLVALVKPRWNLLE
jgi:hypothetical protein